MNCKGLDPELSGSVLQNLRFRIRIQKAKYHNYGSTFPQDPEPQHFLSFLNVVSSLQNLQNVNENSSNATVAGGLLNTSKLMLTTVCIIYRCIRHAEQNIYYLQYRRSV